MKKNATPYGNETWKAVVAIGSVFLITAIVSMVVYHFT